MLTVDRLEFGIADPIGNRPEGCTRFDRLELLRIADKDELGAGFGDSFDEERHLP